MCVTHPHCIFRHRFGGRIAELESQLEAAKSKASRVEKEKSKLTIEIENIMSNLDDVSGCCFNVHGLFVKGQYSLSIGPTSVLNNKLYSPKSVAHTYTITKN